jgi:geranylgeranyl diphosphate synthase type I
VAQGGKRLRPALVLSAYRACGGQDDATAQPLAQATELLHTYLLIHDDIMDHAELRRGQPTGHVLFERRHAAAGWRGSSADFGRSVAILLGDLSYSLAVELFSTVLVAAASPSPSAAELAGAFAAMCREVIGGQYLELALAHRPVAGEASADLEAELLAILRQKSGRYTAERPIELGALLAGAPAALRHPLARYGRAIGEAFQLQDDLLGMFGDASRVGKPVGEDLREGKLTFLIFHALRHATAAERALLTAALGDPDLSPAAAERARAVIEETGARQAVDAMVEARLDEARQALAAVRDQLEPAGGDFLADLADHLGGRER